MPVERIFLGWDRPLITAVTDFLCAGRSAQPLDLSDTWVLAPTQQAGRRLREALALRAAGQGTGLWSPRVTAPNGILSPPPEPRPATTTEVDALWLEVLREIRLSEFPALFPARPPVQDAAWALPLGRALRHLRSTLGEGGLRIADVLARHGEALVELDRWEDLARLEKNFLRRATALGLADPVSASLAAALRPQLPSGFTRVVVAAVADLSGLAQGALTVLSESLQVQVLVAAPAERADDFDAWGRPRPERWAGEPIEIPDEEQNLILCGSPAGQARRVAAWMEEEAARFPASQVAVGVPDPEVTAPLAAALAERGQRVHDPAGRPVGDHPVAQLLSAACQLAGGGDYAAVSGFIRHADLLDALARAHHVDPSAVLAQLDDFQNEYLPAGLSDFTRRIAGALPEKEYGSLARAVEMAGTLCDDVQAGSVETALRALLKTVYASRTVKPGEPAGEAFVEVGRVVSDTLGELGRLPALGLKLAAGDFLELLLGRLREESWYPDREPDAMDLEGWLELPWNDAAFVILTGLNEGLVPEGQVADLFLPDSLRSRLGLRCDTERVARDAFILKGLIESRRAAGRVALALGRISAAGDPLRPSRLLFRCPDDELPARCRRLFGEVQEPRRQPAVTVPFLLRPARAAKSDPLERLRVTSFRAYLNCPFRFYLGQVLGMASVDDSKVELDAMDFGTLVHHALQRMADDKKWAACTDIEALGEFLAAEAEDEMRRRFGAHPPLQIVFQLEAAQQRLRAAARHHVQSVREGWEIMAAEHTIQGSFAGLPVRGRVDRIERHRDSGRLRVIDYKSSDRAAKPEAAHWGGDREEARDYARLTVGGRDRCWIDLQLPLYRLLLAQDAAYAGFQEVEVGYFNLPKAVSETGIVVWPDFTPDLLESARRCAEGVAADIQAGRFWPPRENVSMDDFASLFYGPVGDFVDAEGMGAG